MLSLLITNSLINKDMLIKKLLIIIAAMIVDFCPLNAQQKEKESESITLKFMESSGSFLVKEFYDLGTIKGVACKVLIITDIVSNKKIGCMRIETSYRSSYNSTPDTYIGTLDADELDACISSLRYLKDKIIPQNAKTYTEAQYKSRDNVEIGAYFSDVKRKWTAYVQTKSYTSRSMEFFEAENLDALSLTMKKAKEMILEKTK